MEAKILDIIKRFAAKDGVRYPGLDVVLFHFLEDEIRIVATDGHCLALFTVKESHNQQPGDSITVKLSDLESISGEISLMMYEKNLFITDEKTVTFKTWPGTGSLKDFPDYEKMMKALPVCGRSLIDLKDLELAGMAYKELGIKFAYVGTHGLTNPLVMKHKPLQIFIMPMDPNE